MFALRTLSYRHRIKGISCSTQLAGNINTTDFYYSQATNSRANRSFQLTMTMECTLTFVPQPTEAVTDSNSSNNKCVIISHTSACLCDWWTLISWKHCYSQQYYSVLRCNTFNYAVSLAHRCSDVSVHVWQQPSCFQQPQRKLLQDMPPAHCATWSVLP